MTAPEWAKGTGSWTLAPDDEAPCPECQPHDGADCTCDCCLGIGVVPAALVALIADAERAGGDDLVLDEEVHDVFARQAAAVNNRGVAAQLCTLWGAGVDVDHLRGLLGLPDGEVTL